MMIDAYIQRFSKLRSDAIPDRWPEATNRRAPHKPFLLLAVMDLFDQASITVNLIELTLDLGELFSLYWKRIMPPGQRENIALPFFYMKREGFWHLIPLPGKEAILEATHQVRSVNQLHSLIAGARLDDGLYPLFCVPDTRQLLRAALINSYFAPDIRPLLVEQANTNVEAFRYSQMILEASRSNRVKGDLEDPDRYRPAVRDQGFRRAIISAYDHRCAVCGIRLLTSDGHTAVDAAHIIPWSLSQDDRLTNGMALCRLCHWAFDEGITGVSRQYKVMVSPQLTAAPNVPGHLATVDGRGISGPAESSLWPDPDALKWHRLKVFRG